MRIELFEGVTDGPAQIITNDRFVLQSEYYVQLNHSAA